MSRPRLRGSRGLFLFLNIQNQRSEYITLRPRRSAVAEHNNDDVLGRFIRLLAKAIVRRLQRDQRRGESAAGDKTTVDEHCEKD